MGSVGSIGPFPSFPSHPGSCHLLPSNSTYCPSSYFLPSSHSSQSAVLKCKPYHVLSLLKTSLWVPITLQAKATKAQRPSSGPCLHLLGSCSLPFSHTSLQAISPFWVLKKCQLLTEAFPDCLFKTPSITFEPLTLTLKPLSTSDKHCDFVYVLLGLHEDRDICHLAHGCIPSTWGIVGPR